MKYHGATETRRRRVGIFPWIVCGLGALFYTYEYLLRISPSVMSSELMAAYGITAGAFGNLMAIYYYAYTPMQLPVGMLMDRYGPRRILTAACAACAVGSYLFASSGHLSVAGVGRFLVGFGSAFAFVGVLKLATIWLPKERFAFVAGLTSALGTIGAMVGETTMTGLVTSVGWRTTVMLSAGIGIILAFIILAVVRDGTKKARVFDVTGAVDFNDIIKGVIRIVFNPYIWLNGLIGCLLYLPATVFAEAWGPIYFQSAYHYSPIDSTYAVDAIFFGFTIGGPVFGFISDRIKSRKRLMILGGLLASICAAITLYIPGIPEWLVIGLMFLMGGFYGSQVLVFAVTRDMVSEQAAASAIAITNMLVMLGGMIFQPLIGVFLDWGWTGEIVNNTHIYSNHDYALSLSILPVGLILGALLAIFLKETHPEAKKA